MSETTVNANFSGATYPVDFKFNFKKDEVGNKRPSVELKAPVASLQGVKEILELDVTPINSSDEEKTRVARNKAQQDLLLEAMYAVYRAQIGAWVGADESNNASKFDPSGFSWEAIANMPKEDRRSSSIPEEQWKAFAVDYSSVMQSVANKAPKELENAVFVYTKKFAPIKTNKPALKFLQGQIALYMEHSKNAENFMDILEMLTSKADQLLNDKSPEDLVKNLGM